MSAYLSERGVREKNHQKEKPQDRIVSYLKDLERETWKISRPDYRIGMGHVVHPQPPLDLFLRVGTRDNSLHEEEFSALLATFPSPGQYLVWWGHETHGGANGYPSHIISRKAIEYAGKRMLSPAMLKETILQIWDYEYTRDIELSTRVLYTLRIEKEDKNQKNYSNPLHLF